MTILAPEWIVIWAIRQLMHARVLRDFRNSRTDKGKLTQSVISSFAKQPSDLIAEWTLTNGFFMGMGGFILQNDGAPVFPLVFLEHFDKHHLILPWRLDFENFYAVEKNLVRDAKFDSNSLKRCISRERYWIEVKATGLQKFSFSLN